MRQERRTRRAKQSTLKTLPFGSGFSFFLFFFGGGGGRGGFGYFKVKKKGVGLGTCWNLEQNRSQVKYVWFCTVKTCYRLVAPLLPVLPPRSVTGSEGNFWKISVRQREFGHRFFTTYRFTPRLLKYL
jgi:hypothetical protein